MVAHRQGGEKGPDLGRTHLGGVAPIMVENIPLDPVNVRLLGWKAVMPRPKKVAYPIA